MQITCPECQFTRVVDESKIPARSQVATCPKCQTKFQFRELEPEEPEFEIEPEPTPESAKIKPNRPTQGTLPLETTSEQVEDEYYEDEQYEEKPDEEQAMPRPIGYDPGEQDIDEEAHVDEEDEGPSFPEMAEPEQPKKMHHPSGEIWEKLHNMTPPGRRVEDDEPAQSPFDDEPEAQPLPRKTEQEPVPGWTGEFNSDFPDPMDDELRNDDDDDGQAPLVPPPFEQLDRYGFFLGLYMTIKLVLTSPRLFFSVMPVGGGISKPLTFAILIAMIQSLAQLVWGLGGLSIGVSVVNQELAAVPLNPTESFFNLLFTPAMIAMTLFIFAGIYQLLVKLLVKGNKGFEGTFRALSYSYAPMITGIIPLFNIGVNIGWMTVYSIWGLVLSAVALKHIHKTSYAKVIPVILLPFLLGAIVMVLAMQASVATI